MLAGWLEQDGRAALVRLDGTDGSSPREAGAVLILRVDGGFSGTIGGGALEFEALAEARALLAKGAACGHRHRIVLGPALGQCCGGAVVLRLEVFTRDDLGWIAPLGAAEAAGRAIDTTQHEDAAGRLVRLIGPGGSKDRLPVMLCGAGHVGRALALALAPLPFHVDWIDSRAEAFPAHVPANVTVHCVADPVMALDQDLPGTALCVLTHSHALDLALIGRALPDPRFAYVGMIGSATKRARFEGMMRRAGLAEGDIARLVCPIGGRALADKQPAAIAAAIAYELLLVRQLPA